MNAKAIMKPENDEGKPECFPSMT